MSNSPPLAALASVSREVSYSMPQLTRRPGESGGGGNPALLGLDPPGNNSDSGSGSPPSVRSGNSPANVNALITLSRTNSGHAANVLSSPSMKACLQGASDDDDDRGGVVNYSGGCANPGLKRDHTGVPQCPSENSPVQQQQRPPPLLPVRAGAYVVNTNEQSADDSSKMPGHLGFGHLCSLRPSENNRTRSPGGGVTHSALLRTGNGVVRSGREDEDSFDDSSDVDNAGGVRAVNGKSGRNKHNNISSDNYGSTDSGSQDEQEDQLAVSANTTEPRPSHGHALHAIAQFAADQQARNEAGAPRSPGTSAIAKMPQFARGASSPPKQQPPQHNPQMHTQSAPPAALPPVHQRVAPIGQAGAAATPQWGSVSQQQHYSATGNGGGGSSSMMQQQHNIPAPNRTPPVVAVTNNDPPPQRSDFSKPLPSLPPQQRQSPQQPQQQQRQPSPQSTTATLPPMQRAASNSAPVAAAARSVAQPQTTQQQRQLSQMANNDNGQSLHVGALPAQSFSPKATRGECAPATEVGGSSAQKPDDNDDAKSDDGSAHGSSHAGTNSTGSGECEEEDPFLMAVIEITRKVRKRARDMELKGLNPDGSTPTGTPQQGQLDASGSPKSEASASSPHLSREKLVVLCKQYQMQLYNDLENCSSRAVVIGDPQRSVIVFANEAAQRLFGRLDLVGAKLESLMPENIAERHAGIIAAYVERYISEYKKSGQQTDSRLLDVVPPRRLTIIRKVNGKDVPVHVDAWVRSLRVQGEALDRPATLMCLEAVEAEQTHVDADSARIFKAALNNVSDSIVIADYNGRIEWLNRSMEKLCGYPLTAIRAVRGTVNLFLPEEISHNQHDGFLQHFRNTRTATVRSLTAESQHVVVQRRVHMRTPLPPFREEILLRVEVAYDKLVAFIKSTAEFIPRDEFESERLKLLLPASVVKMLRGTDSSLDITSHFWEFDNKTCFFTDVENFSEWSRARSAQAVHDRMQPMFAEFEQIIQAFGGELVHRVGDAVLAVFGLNGEERHHARYAVACAAEIQQWCTQNGFSLRIGVHSGTIGAGIYGSSKGRPGFDVWGPVVNAAKRLESACAPGAVHITQEVVRALGHKMAGPIHQIVVPHRIEGVKGIADQDTVLLPVTQGIEEKFQQLVNQQRARFARWKIQSEETERRLAELQKATRA